MTRPILVFGYGNLSRGDDALGVLILEHIEARFSLETIDLLTDFQLQIEHALDLENRELVVFVDASVKGESAFEFTQLQPVRDLSHTTHAMSPAAILDVYQTMKKETPPPCFLLAIGAESFELGDGLSENATRNLTKASEFIETLLNNPTFDFWHTQITK
ncbi:MAG: hydrogenase maturation protease [Methylococcales bacterium]|nr:hydrogenase maturation protease [Methylococcales bacterium]MDD5753330.1 hydrogenase maturation protease [Methylococcales bacterium]